RAIGDEVARLFLALLLALALLPTPASGMVPTPYCTMAQVGTVMPPAGHDEGCCTGPCVMSPAAMAVPSAETGAQPPELVAPPHWPAASAAFRSANPAADDPPPRP